MHAHRVPSFDLCKRPTMAISANLTNLYHLVSFTLIGSTSDAKNTHSYFQSLSVNPKLASPCPLWLVYLYRVSVRHLLHYPLAKVPVRRRGFDEPSSGLHGGRERVDIPVSVTQCCVCEAFRSPPESSHHSRGAVLRASRVGAPTLTAGVKGYLVT